MTLERESSAGSRTLRSALGVYAERRALVMVALGFSSALPYFLVFDTLAAWLRTSGLPLDVIGFFSLVTMVSSFKFLWAPFVDRARVPWLTDSSATAARGCWCARASSCSDSGCSPGPIRRAASE